MAKKHAAKKSTATSKVWTGEGAASLKAGFVKALASVRSAKEALTAQVKEIWKAIGGAKPGKAELSLIRGTLIDWAVNGGGLKKSSASVTVSVLMGDAGLAIRAGVGGAKGKKGEAAKAVAKKAHTLVSNLKALFPESGDAELRAILKAAIAELNK